MTKKPTTDETELLWSVDQVCTALGGLHACTVHRLFADGTLHRVKFGKRTFVLVSEVRAYVAQLAEQSRAA